MSPNLKQDCYGFATGCYKLYFSFIGCRKPLKKLETTDLLVWVSGQIKWAKKA